MADYTPGQEILLSTFNSATGETDWRPGIFIGYASEVEPRRLNVKYADGWEVNDLDPDYVKPAE
jgi:hypothetical protein